MNPLTENTKSRLAAPLLLIGVFFWGGTFPAIKTAISTTDIFSFLAIRFAVSALILAAVFHKNLTSITPETSRKGLIIGLMLALSFILQTIGLKLTTASNSAFITGLYIVLVPISVIVLDRKIPPATQLAAVALALAGLSLITLRPGFRIAAGDAWTLACAAAFGIHVVMIGRMVKNIDAPSFTIVQLATVATVAAVSAVSGLAVNGRLTLPSGSQAWGALLFCAIFAGAYMYTVQAQFQRHMSEIRAVVIYSFEPVFGAAAAALLLGERLSPRAAAGGACVVIAMILSDLKLKKNNAPAKTDNRTL